MTPQAQINRLTNELDDLATDLRGSKATTRAAKKVESAMFQLMEAREELTRQSVGELVNVAFKQYGGKGDSGPVVLRRVG